MTLRVLSFFRDFTRDAMAFCLEPKSLSYVLKSTLYFRVAIFCASWIWGSKFIYFILMSHLVIVVQMYVETELKT